MERERYLTAIERDGELLVDAAARAGLDAPVPSCPGWSVSDLLGHLGQAHRWVADNTTRPPAGAAATRVDPPPPADRAQWVRDGIAELLAALDRAPDDPAWTFRPPSTVGFWQRRMAFETAMHRVDAELAAGASVTPVEGELASDGIDARLAELATFGPGPATSPAETVHLHCTDVPGEWLVTFAPDEVEVVAQHAKADAAARGTADDLLVWSYGRRPTDVLEVFGDRALLERFRDGLIARRRA